MKTFFYYITAFISILFSSYSCQAPAIGQITTHTETTDNFLPTNSPQSYWHLKGTIGTHSVILDFNLDTDSTLFGVLYDATVTKSFFISGDLEKENKISLYISTMDRDESFSLNIQLYATKKWEGTWTEKNKKEAQVSLEENYDKAVQFQAYSLFAQEHLFDDEEMPAYEISLFYLYPQYSDLAPLALVQESMHLALFNEHAAEKQIEKKIESIKEKLFTDYRNSIDDLTKEDMEEFGMYYQWFYSDVTKILRNNDGILAFSFFNYTFAGGAHGLPTEVYWNIDTETGKIIIEEDFFVPNYKKELAQIIQKNLFGEDGLPEFYFSKENIVPNGNFLFLNDCIIYLYNVYEIAPYSEGAIEVTIPMSQIKHLIRKK